MQRQTLIVATGIVALVAGCGSPEQGRSSGGGAIQMPGQPAPQEPAFGNSVAGSPSSTGPQASPVSSECQAGHYVGTFTGEYRSGAWGNGATPLMVTATDSGAEPGLQFWLESSEAPCVVDEFCADFVVKGGKIKGFADPSENGDGLVKVPFEIDLEGELDCAAGNFRGELDNGWYDFGGTIYSFEGSIVADYDVPSASFLNGVWDVLETAQAGALIPPDPNIGGEGVWEASLVP